MAKPIKTPTYAIVPGRLSYVHVFEKHAFEGQDEGKYSVMLLIPKTDKTTIAKLKKAIEAAKEAGKISKWGGKIPASFKTPIRDGDTDENYSEYPEFAGMWFIRASSNRKPEVVDRHVQKIIDPEEIYSGCYGKISVNAFPYKSGPNMGVSFGLNNVQKLEDGDRLDGSRRAGDDFENEDVEEIDSNDIDDII